MSQLSRGDVLDRLAAGESLRGVNLVRADLASMDLTRIDLSEANLRMADLSRSTLREARLTSGSLSGANLEAASLVNANLAAASLIGVSLKQADLSGADLSGADLTGANLSAATLAGSYLVGTFLNETHLRKANLSSAFIRFAQLAGSDLTGANLDGADLSNVDLSSARMDGCSLVGTRLAGANLVSSALLNCDLRDADLTGADLSGCDLTGAKLHGVKTEGVILNDTWAEWVNLSADGRSEARAHIKKVFPSMVSRPMAQIMVEGRIGDEVWAALLTHLCEFQMQFSQFEVKLKALQQGSSSSVWYLEAPDESTLAAYLKEFAEIMGNGAESLREKLIFVLNDSAAALSTPSTLSSKPLSLDLDAANPFDQGFSSEDSWVIRVTSHMELLQQTTYWNREKAVAILTSDGHVWLQAVSKEALTLRRPPNVTLGTNLLRGRFISDEPEPQDPPLHNPLLSVR